MAKKIGIVWKDKVTNVEVRRRIWMGKLEHIIRERRLRWLGHQHRMEQRRIQKYSQLAKGRGDDQEWNWTSTVKKDLEGIGMTWEEAERAAGDRTVWKSCVAQCAEGTGWTKV